MFVCRMLELAKAMGLTLSRQTVTSREGIQDEHRMASLVLPLVHYDRRVERKKRKRMNWAVNTSAFLSCVGTGYNCISFCSFINVLNLVFL